MDHPFLLVTQGQYADLQARAERPPWKDMKEAALRAVPESNWDRWSSQSPERRALAIQRTTSVCGLLYILDPGRREVYRAKILAALHKWDDVGQRARAGWSNYVPVASAFLQSVVAYDIISSDVSGSDRRAVETKLEAVADWYYSNPDWSLPASGAVGTWYLFKHPSGDHPRFRWAQRKTRENLYAGPGPDTRSWERLPYITPNGLFQPGSNYSFGRMFWSSENSAKVHFMDILSFTGQEDYYEKEVMKRYFQWVFHFNVTPFGWLTTFGDSRAGLDAGGFACNPRSYTLYRWDPELARFRAWVQQLTGERPENDPRTILMNYLLMNPDGPETRVQKPATYIIPDGAAMHEAEETPESLMGLLFTNTGQGPNTGHALYETNAVYLAGYGVHLIRNVGRTVGAGPDARPGYWSAKNQNAVVIDGREHTNKGGGRTAEGLASDAFDYACGDDGPVIDNGSHLRSFCFVKPGDGRNGYFACFDEVDADDGNVPVQVNFKPNSKTCTTVAENAHYRWAIDLVTSERNPSAGLNIFLGTQPSSVSIYDGPFLDRGRATPRSVTYGRAIRSEYATDGAGKAQIVTLLYPTDQAHPLPNGAKSFSRLAPANGYSGCKVAYADGATDYLAASDGSAAGAYGGVTFKGRAVVCRVRDGQTLFYFVRQGEVYDDETSRAHRRGFQTADGASASVYMAQGLDGAASRGRIVTDGAEITFREPGITGVILNGSPLTALAGGAGWVRVHIPQTAEPLQGDLLELATGGAAAVSSD